MGNATQTKIPFVKFIFKFTAPDRLATSAIPQRIPSLNHKSFDYTMKYKIVIITVPAMCSEVLHSFRTLFWIQSQVNVTHRSMQHLKYDAFIRGGWSMGGKSNKKSSSSQVKKSNFEKTFPSSTKLRSNIPDYLAMMSQQFSLDLIQTKALLVAVFH